MALWAARSLSRSLEMLLVPLLFLSDVTPHLTMTADPTEMVVSWAEPGESATLSRVRYGLSPDALVNVSTNASSVMVTLTEDMSTYDYCGKVTATHTLHMVRLHGLPPDTNIFYAADTVPVCDATRATDAVKNVSTFRTRPLKSAASLRFLATADMGDQASHPWTAIPEMVRLCAAEGSSAQPIELGLHIGDIAYNLDIEPRGDSYMAETAQMSATFPWMVAPGNHEADCNYTYANYRGRFAAQNLTGSPRGPNSDSSRWYSFELGPVHFAAIDTDAYGFDEVAPVLKPQYEWLAADLAAVDREATPFVILMGHRPMYCSATAAASSSRLGWPKQPDGMSKDAPPPDGYGDGFRAHGVHPPPWRPLDASAANGGGAPSCGVTTCCATACTGPTAAAASTGSSPSWPSTGWTSVTAARFQPRRSGRAVCHGSIPAAHGVCADIIR